MDNLGSRKKEAVGKFSSGGWARIDPSKQANGNPGTLDLLTPAESFMEKITTNNFIGSLRHQAWLSRRYWQKGMVSSKQMVYVVTEEKLSDYHWIHDRWPWQN